MSDDDNGYPWGVTPTQHGKEYDLAENASRTNGTFHSGTPNIVEDMVRQNHPERFGNSGGGGAGCFTGDTKILTPTGFVRLDSLKKNDIVLSWKSSTQEIVEQRVKRLVTYKPAPIWSLSVGDTDPVRPTHRHSFLTQEGWKMTRQLSAADCLLVATGKPTWIRIKDIHKTNVCEPVYNLVTEGEHNFLVNGIVAHNFTFLRTSRSMAHNIVEAVRNALTEAELKKGLSLA